MIFYHYSSESIDILKSLRKQRILSSEEIKRGKQDMKDTGKQVAYYDHISLFIEPPPLDIIAKLFNHEHPFWKSGALVYEHEINSDDIDKDLWWEIVESPAATKMYDDVNWSEKYALSETEFESFINDYFKRRNVILAKMGCSGNNLNKLVKESSKYIGTTRQYYIDASKYKSDDGNRVRYAARVPHLMVYPKCGYIRPTSVQPVFIK